MPLVAIIAIECSFKTSSQIGIQRFQRLSSCSKSVGFFFSVILKLCTFRGRHCSEKGSLVKTSMHDICGCRIRDVRSYVFAVMLQICGRIYNEFFVRLCVSSALFCRVGFSVWAFPFILLRVFGSRWKSNEFFPLVCREFFQVLGFTT